MGNVHSAAIAALSARQFLRTDSALCRAGVFPAHRASAGWFSDEGGVDYSGSPVSHAAWGAVGGSAAFVVGRWFGCSRGDVFLAESC